MGWAARRKQRLNIENVEVYGQQEDEFAKAMDLLKYTTGFNDFKLNSRDFNYIAAIPVNTDKVHKPAIPFIFGIFRISFFAGDDEPDDRPTVEWTHNCLWIIFDDGISKKFFNKVVRSIERKIYSKVIDRAFVDLDDFLWNKSSLCF